MGKNNIAAIAVYASISQASCILMASIFSESESETGHFAGPYAECLQNPGLFVSVNMWHAVAQPVKLVLPPRASF